MPLFSILVSVLQTTWNTKEGKMKPSVVLLTLAVVPGVGLLRADVQGPSHDEVVLHFYPCCI